MKKSVLTKKQFLKELETIGDRMKVKNTQQEFHSLWSRLFATTKLILALEHRKKTYDRNHFHGQQWELILEMAELLFEKDMLERVNKCPCEMCNPDLVLEQKAEDIFDGLLPYENRA